MGALTKLCLFKQWSKIRNTFSKPSSAMLTLFLIFVYGGMMIAMLSMKLEITTFSTLSLHQSVLIGIAMSAFILFTTMLQKRKALFMQEDSFYLFSGPFSRRQVMQFLMSQTILQAFMFSLLSVVMMVSLGGELRMTIPFLIVSVVANMFLYFFFINLTDYLYILSITNKRYKNIAKLIVILIVTIVVLIFVISLAQNNFDIKNGVMNFVESDLFYAIPMFGWVKLLLISFYFYQWSYVAIALALILTAIVILYVCLTRFKGDFYEQVMMDSIELSEQFKRVRAGKQNGMNLNTKVYASTSSFRQGAGAIFSKNFLVMKKTRDFIRLQDGVILVVYLAVSFFSNMGFGFFYYLMIFWLFQFLQTSTLLQELKNYQIYLIPADPFEKLICVMLPTMMKLSILISAAVVISGVVYQMNVFTILQYILALWGYGLIFIAGTILSVRLMKSRTNVGIENLMRLGVILLSSIPSLILLLISSLLANKLGFDALFVGSMVSFIVNAIVSIVIIYLCKGMMNGRELNSD